MQFRLDFQNSLFGGWIHFFRVEGGFENIRDTKKYRDPISGLIRRRWAVFSGNKQFTVIQPAILFYTVQAYNVIVCLSYQLSY